MLIAIMVSWLLGTSVTAQPVGPTAQLGRPTEKPGGRGWIGPPGPGASVLTSDAYEMYVEIVEGSVVCRQGLLAFEGGALLAYDAWLQDPNATTVAGETKQTYSYRLEGQYSHSPATSGTYTCYARFSADGYALGTSLNRRFINSCNDDRGVMIDEYRTYSVNLSPSCSDFASSGDSTHFSWNELNGGFSTGNPHTPFGMVTTGLTTGLESTRANYARGGIRLTSGYRCPHGNSNVAGAPQSYHVYGRAADMYSSDHPWTEEEFLRLQDAAELTGPIESLAWDAYSDRHYHAAW